MSVNLTLAALECALKSVDPVVLVRRAVKLEDDNSRYLVVVRDIYGKTVRLDGFDGVYVVGAGKAVARMASALYCILRNRITAGAITVPYGSKVQKNTQQVIAVTEASHPVPDRAGVQGTMKILSILKKAGRKDLVFILISGGGSALMPMPASGVSLADKQRVTNMLLRSGASIHEINTVRKHLSLIKGGQLLRYANRSCTKVSLILSDVIGDDLGVIASGPTYPDKSTFGDALRILKKYRIVAKASDPVMKHIGKGVKGTIDDTPKPGDPVFDNVYNILIGNNALACQGAANYLNQQGLRTAYLGSGFDGEAKDFGKFLARLAFDLAYDISAPFALVAGGETTVHLNKLEKVGTGGRNLESALSYAITAASIAPEHVRQSTIITPGATTITSIAAACMGTDGIDGNSDAAGAVVSLKVISLARKKNLNLRKYLMDHDSYHALKQLNSLIFTGQTGTNVNDIAIICCHPAKYLPRKSEA